MKLVADLHTHTIASGHAYSTVLENTRVAADRGLEMIALTDHGPALPGGTYKHFFANLRVLPVKIFGVEVLRGIEANIMDQQGALDLNDYFLEKLDIVLAGLHRDCYDPGSVEGNTRALIGAIASGRVDVIVHPGNPAFPIDGNQVAEAAARHGVLLEINNSSLSGLARKGSRDNCFQLADLVARHKGRVCLGSDAHFAGHVGELDAAAALASRHLTPEQIINTSCAAIHEFLVSRGRRRESVRRPLV